MIRSKSKVKIIDRAMSQSEKKAKQKMRIEKQLNESSFVTEELIQSIESSTSFYATPSSTSQWSNPQCIFCSY